jgi:hypothetical protein
MIGLLSDASLNEFIDMYETVHGERLSVGDARNVAEGLVTAYGRITQPASPEAVRRPTQTDREAL